MWLALVILNAALDTYTIPAESSKPTLLIGDYVVALRINPAVLERGDMVVFVHPINGQDYIKRLIGLPGDTVQMRDGVVWLNNAPLVQKPSGTFEEVYAPQGPMGNIPRCANAPVGLGGTCVREKLIEIFPDGRHHEILNIENDAALDNTDQFTVPEGMMFVLGDNRDNSLDSRAALESGGIGFVPLKNVTAKPLIVAFSSGGTSLLNVGSWRPSRYWKVIE